MLLVFLLQCPLIIRVSQNGYVALNLCGLPKDICDDLVGMQDLVQSLCCLHVPMILRQSLEIFDLGTHSGVVLQKRSFEIRPEPFRFGLASTKRSV